MGFLDTLRERNRILGAPAGSTYGQEMYFGQPPIISGGIGGGFDAGLGPIFDPMRENRLMNRELTDFAAKTRISGDEAIRQDNIRRLFDPNMRNMSGGMTSLMPPNTIYQPSPGELVQAEGQITPIRAAQLGLEKEKIKQTGRLAEATLGFKERDFQLDKLKNDQIYGTKIADMERKANEAAAKLELAEKKLEADSTNSRALADHRAAQIELAEARMKLMSEQHAATLAENKRMNDERIAKLQADIARLSGVQVKEEELGEDEEGNPTRTTRTSIESGSGPAIGTIKTFPNGRKGKWDGRGYVPMD